MKYTFAILAFLITLSGFCQAVQDFTLVNVADGKKISLYSYQSCEGIAVLFTSNDCPYDTYYFDRIKTLIDSYKGTIQFLLINSFVESEESVKAMADKYATWGLPIPYLSDKDQTAMNYLGAKKSSEVFLLRKKGKDYVIAYQGAIDDNPQVAEDVGESYLKTSIEALIKKKRIPVTATRPVGCTIRKK